MKTITKEIPDFLAFPIDPEHPEEMDQKYPYMPNIVDEPNLMTLPDPSHPGQYLLFLTGQSSHMDNLENAIFYGGILGRRLLHDHPHLVGHLSRIIMTNLVKSGGVEEAEDGYLKVIWPKKTLRYLGQDGKMHCEDVDIEMDYVDSEKIQNPKGNLLEQSAWLWHGGDPDELADQDLAKNWKDLLDKAEKEEEKSYQSNSIWEKFEKSQANYNFEMVINKNNQNS